MVICQEEETALELLNAERMAAEAKVQRARGVVLDILHKASQLLWYRWGQ